MILTSEASSDEPRGLRMFRHIRIGTIFPVRTAEKLKSKTPRRFDFALMRI
eukprot:COSAG02_NODE_35360_length_469_cov_1.154054_1_plen_50_part_10